jgi:ABC-type glycerol-3-phosphate transport system permease component
MISKRKHVGASLIVNALINIFIIFLVVVWVIVPLLYGFSMAFMPQKELNKVPPSLYPHEPSLVNFERVVREGLYIGSLYWNTFITATVAVITTLFFSSLAGYAFAKFKFFARDQLFILVILKLMIPEAALVIAWFYITGTIGMLDNVFAIVLPSLIGAWSIFFMRQYIQSVPDSLIDSARIDGAREIRIFFSIIVPVIKPAVGAAIIINYMYAWNWFLWPLVVLQTNENFTMNLGLNFIRWIEMGGGENPTDYGAVMAMSFLYTVPFVIIYFIFQRFFVESITLTGLKE